jgi:hypothetical protein
MSGDARDMKHWAIWPGRARKAPQFSPSLPQPGPQDPPVSNSPAEPAHDPAEKAFWLNTAFPTATAREEQIRQAAQALDRPSQPPPVRGGDGPDQTRAHRDLEEQARADLSRHGVTAKPGRRHDGFAAFPRHPVDRPASEPARIQSDRAISSIAAARTLIATEIAGTDDPRDLADRVRQALHLATVGMAVPGDRLEELQRELAARRPGDAAFREIIDRESELAEAEWAAQGRTHEVFDPLVLAADAGDWQELEALLIGQFAFIASVTPTAQAIEQHKLLLLTYGPQTPVFQMSVSRTAGQFLVERPQRDAAAIAKVLQSEAPVAAVAKLRELIDHNAADPLSAGQILSRSAKSIDEIVRHLCTVLSSASRAEAFADDSPAGIASASYPLQAQVFSDLNAAADSASRSEQGIGAMKHLAGLLRDAPIDRFVTMSIRNGDGIILPLEIARLRLQNGASQSADELALLIQLGVQGMREVAGDAVRAFDATLSLLTARITGKDGQTNDAQVGVAATWEQADPDIVESADAQVAVLNRHGYALARTMRSLENPGAWLDGLANHDALRQLGTVPDEENFAGLSFLLGVMPASLAEQLRQGDADLPEPGTAGSTYLRVRDLAVALQWIQDFRQFLVTPHHESG